MLALFQIFDVQKKETQCSYVFSSICPYLILESDSERFNRIIVSAISS